LLVSILLITIGSWGLFNGQVHAVSLGFAAILLGLSADYGLILFQEYQADPSQSVRHHLAAVAPSIFWAASTTAAAFSMMGLSSLPGMRQLGLLVGIGIIVAAVVMTTCYLQPSAVRADAGKRKKEPGSRAGWLYRPRIVLGVTVVLAAVSAVAIYQQPPAVDYNPRNLGPKENPVRETLEEVQRRIGGYGASLWIIASGANPGKVNQKLRDAARLLDQAVEDGILESYILPVEIWPHPHYQQQNRKRVLSVLERWPQIEQEVLEAGFSKESLKLARMVFTDWKRFAAQKGVVLPTQPASQWVFSQFATEYSGKELALGRLSAAPDASEGRLLELSRSMYSATGNIIFGWSLLSESLSGLIKRDIMRVLIPIGIVVLILLAATFRKIGEILLSLATIAFSILCLLATMSVLGWSWNLMNILALPLLFGAGVDYSIHIQLALRRFGGDLASVRRTVVKAILLCGLSTALGFGSLALASNIGMASLGRICALGILIISLTAAFMLPVWWRLLKRVS
jgi:predicted exporter